MKPLKFLSPIHKAYRQIFLYFEDRARSTGMIPVEGHIITFLLSYAPVPITELNRVFGLKPSTLTSMLDRLESRGIIERLANPKDRRSWLIQLTDEGEEVAAQVRAEAEQFESDIAGRITDEDMQGFKRVLEALSEVARVDVRKNRND